MLHLFVSLHTCLLKCAICASTDSRSIPLHECLQLGRCRYACPVQALLRWLDGLTEELEACDAKVLDSELQRTVETALRRQAKDSTSHRPVLHRESAERKGRHRQW